MLGAMLLSGPVIGALVINERLRPDHFWRPRHALIYQAAMRLFERGEPVDAQTVIDELARMGKVKESGDQPYVHALPTLCPAVGAFRSYAGRVVETARLRQKLDAARRLQEAVQAEDWAAIAQAEGDLVVEEAVASRKDGAAWAELVSHIVEGKERSEAFPFPFGELNSCTNGGMRRKQVTLVGGWTNTGKSLIVDQILDSAAKAGAKAHLYINEMGLEDRGLRLLARKSGVPYWKLAQAQVTEQSDFDKIVKGLSDFRFGVTECAGWSAEEVAYDIRRNRWDVAAFDILHRTTFEDERDLSNASSALNDAAKQADAHVLVAVHLNEARATTGKLPKPVLRDIRGSGSLKNDADNVLFVWRQQEGEFMEDSGRVWLAKVRNGRLGGCNVNFSPSKLMFTQIQGEL